MFDKIKKGLNAFREDPGDYVQHLNPAQSAGLAGAALVAILGVAEGVQHGVAALTEDHERITVQEVRPETPKASNLWGYKIGTGEEIVTTTGQVLEDRPAWALGKWTPAELTRGKTYDVSTYSFPFMGTNIREATEIDKEKED